GERVRAAGARWARVRCRVRVPARSGHHVRLRAAHRRGGPWLPYQMLAAGWVGLGAGLLPAGGGGRQGRPGRRQWPAVAEIVLLAAYGAVASVGYGVIMNLSYWPFLTGTGTELSFVAGAPLGENLGRFAAYSVVTSLGWDLTRAVTTVVGIAVFGHMVLVTLRRA